MNKPYMCEVHKQIIYLNTSLDGSEPTTRATKYTGPFLVASPTTVKAVGFDSDRNKFSDVTSRMLDITKKGWTVVKRDSALSKDTDLMIDEDPETFWATDAKGTNPREVIIDLGQDYELIGFTYWPIQERYPFGIITDYAFSVSMNGRKWEKVAEGEFSNIINSRLEQRVDFPLAKARYIKLKADKIDGEGSGISFAEVGVLTKG